MKSLPAVRLQEPQLSNSPGHLRPMAVRSKGAEWLAAIAPATPRMLAEPYWSLGTEAADVDFGKADFHHVEPHSALAFGEAIIVTRGSEALIETLPSPDHPDGERRVLTSEGGQQTECRILFRHAYGTVTCHFGVKHIVADTRLGFLGPKFKEISTFELKQPRHARHGTLGFWTSLSYTATQLNELHGIVWRGGALCMERIELRP